MRRLLDVAWRKSADKAAGHYIIKRLPQLPGSSALNKVATTLEEQDANNLGLKVIWIEDFSEISEVLTKIADID